MAMKHNVKTKMAAVILLLTPTLSTLAQKEQPVKLNEVKVEAARVVSKPNGQYIMPTEAQRLGSANGYGLLAKLGLARVRVDEVMHTVTAADNLGTVQLRINGALASREDLLALDPKLVTRIDYVSNPGVRYGAGVACVLDIHTRRSEAGHTVGTQLANTLTAWHGNDAVYAKWNRGRGELGLTYNMSYQDFRGDRYAEEADYLLTDESHRTVSRTDQTTRSRSFDNNIELKYNLADSTNYVFQATLAGAFSHAPGNGKTVLVADAGRSQTAMNWQSDKQCTPSLDLYFFCQLGSHQTLTANVVGTHIATTDSSYTDEGSAYAYQVEGRTWSLLSEAIYENRLHPVTLSLGLRHTQKYTCNTYTGDAAAVNGMHNRGLYLFGEAQGKVGPIDYVAGMGASCEHYRQQGHSYDYWLLRPKTTLNWTVTRPLSLRYVFEISQHISKIAMISDTRIRRNSLEWTVGNPDIRPNRVTTHRLTIDYTRPRWQSEMEVEYRMNHNCNLAKYTRTDDNQFLYTQANQPACNMLRLQGSLRYDIVPDKLTASADASLCRFFNLGDDYRHYLTSYNIYAALKAYLGRWTLMAYADNGWKFMEGESQGHQGAATYLACSYRMGRCMLALHWQHPLQSRMLSNEGELKNKLIHKRFSLHSSDRANMLTLRLTWRLDRGRRYRDIDRTLHNKDTQTGIL